MPNRRRKSARRNYEPTAACVRFKPLEIAERLDDLRREAGIAVPEMAARIWPDREETARFQWYKKAAGRGSSFEIWEIDRACEVIAELAPAYNPPPGFPFLSLEYASAAARSLRGRK